MNVPHMSLVALLLALCDMKRPLHFISLRINSRNLIEVCSGNVEKTHKIGLEL